VRKGGTIAEAFRNTLDLARHAEQWGYTRFWLAEHHNMQGIASAATAVLIGYVAGGTSTIRVGSGGIMLPNHAPLVIAEQFGTLETLYPGRIDLGVGRAPGTDQMTTRALRRDSNAAADFPEQVEELLRYLAPAEQGQKVRAVPGAGTNVPVWLLGSSTFSAQLAALMGLSFAFAGHFAPQDMRDALRLYRQRFEPSGRLADHCRRDRCGGPATGNDSRATGAAIDSRRAVSAFAAGGEHGRIVELNRARLRRIQTRSGNRGRSRNCGTRAGEVRGRDGSG
jgi:luciferase family oxidoreductase group 1